MGFKDTLATSAAPVFLRCALGITFLWAGLGKCFVTDRISPVDAAILANMAVITSDQGVSPTTKPSAQGGASAGLVLAMIPVAIPSPILGQNSAPGAAAPNTATPPASTPASPPNTPASGTPAKRQADAPPPMIHQPPPQTPVGKGRQYTAADFPNGAEVLRLHTVTLKLSKAANPPAGRPALWPRVLDQSPWPVALAYAAALTEVLAGFLALTGLLGRFAGFALAVVMLNAIWLDQIGPAIQAGQTSFFILPAYPAFDVNAWRPLLWQFALLMLACGLACTGSGGMSLDRMVGGGGSGGGKPASKPKPKDEI